MGFSDKNNNADGRDPEFGAIFMSNSGTKRECFKRRLFGLPSSEIHFVEQVKTGMILFLFEYEKRQLHGVFKASCDGAMNIVPNAFTSSGKQFPAQVKFIPIWFCKPLPEKSFRDAIRENYFSVNKFNFGLSENQVHKLLYLFSMRKLELEVPGRVLTRAEALKPEGYSLGKVGRSVGRGMHVESVQNDQGVGDNISPVLMHKCEGDSLQYNGKVEYIGSNASNMVNKQGRAAELEKDRSGYVSDYLALNDESRFTAHENEDYMDIHAAELPVDTASGYVSEYFALKDKSRFTMPEKKDCLDIRLRPNIIGRYSEGPSNNVRGHGDGRLSICERLMSEDLRNADWKMQFFDDIYGSHNSNVNPSLLYSKPILEHNSLVQNHLGPTSAMVPPILNQSHVTKGDASSILYEPDVPYLNFSQSSSVGINNGSKSMIEGAFPSTNCGRNALSSSSCLMRTGLKDMNRWHNGSDFLSSVLCGSDRDCMPFNEAQKSDQLASGSVLYEACNNIPSMNSLSALVPPSEIGNSGGEHEPFSSLFQNCKPCLGGDVHPIGLRENLSHDITIQKNNGTFNLDFPWTNEGHSQVQCDDLCNHEYDIGCYDYSQKNNAGHPKKKSSVFSRLSFMQDVNKQENENNAWNKEDAFHTSVDEVMEMASQSHNQWIAKRKPKPSKRNKAESLRDKIEIIALRTKEDSFENTSKDISVDLTTTSGGNSNKTAEEIYFVDFKRRSKVRKHGDKPGDEMEIRNSNESGKSENLVLVPQKRRKLIRPNFNKSTTSDDKGIDLGASQNVQVPLSHGSYNLEDVSERCFTLFPTENNIKTDAEVLNIIGQAHSEDKNSNPAGEYVCHEGGEKAIDGARPAFPDGSACVENVNNQNIFSSASCKDKTCHIKEGLSMKLSMKKGSLDTESLNSICQEHNAEKIVCAGKGIDTEEEMPKNHGSSFSIES